MDLSDRLWRDRSIYQSRAERQAAALVAVFRALEDRRPLQGGEAEAVGLHRWLAALDEGVISDVLSDPYARVWTRLAFALCGAVLRGEAVPTAARAFALEVGSDDAAELLRLHLDQYKRLAVAAALSGNVAVEFATPLAVDLPFAIPAAAASLAGQGVLRILGVANGQIRVDGGTMRPEPCPLARVAGWSVPLQADGWLVPGLGWSAPAASASRAFQESHRELVEGGLALIQRHQPEVFAQMRAVVRWIAVNPIAEGNPLNYVSFSELPGAFAFQGIPNIYGAAEASIHEFHHNRLFCLEECTPILAGDALGTEDDARYYSPWREGLRPLRGVLHGAYVTAAQLRFWLAVARAPDTGGMLAEFVAGQLVRQTVVIDLGLGQLERYARFTPEGALLVAQMRWDLDNLVREAEDVGVPWDADAFILMPGNGFETYRDENGSTLSMREIIVRHIREFDQHRQVPAEWIAANAPLQDFAPAAAVAGLR